MSCLNLKGECCFDETGCIYNNGHNTCMANKCNPMPAEDKPTIAKLERRLAKRHAFTLITHRYIGKRIPGKTYYIYVDGFNVTPEIYTVFIKDNKMKLMVGEQ